MAFAAPFRHALVVEDLDEPRQWLAELLPKALPTIERVDMARDLAEARTLVAAHRHDLALVDWGLPDGTAETLIQTLAARGDDCEIIVATIHDDDAHVFPALRAGATGYILKSQPQAVVIAQLRGIQSGEPALSPSVALRVLRHFRTRSDDVTSTLAPAALVGEAGRLSEREVDVLRLIGKGYSSPEAARVLGLSAQTTSTYVRNIYRKLGISSRAEAAMEAARRGLVA